jgi:hypothetical protein
MFMALKRLHGGRSGMCGITQVVRSLLACQIGCMLQMCAGCTLAAFGRLDRR